MSDFSARLVALRQRRGYSQEQLALKMGITKQTISNYERDIRSPDREMIERLANILDCSVGYIMGTEEEINAQRKLDEIRADGIALAEKKLDALLDQPALPSNVRPISGSSLCARTRMLTNGFSPLVSSRVRSASMAPFQSLDEFRTRCFEPRVEPFVGGGANGVPVATILERVQDVLRHLLPVAVRNAPFNGASEIGEPVGEFRTARNPENRRPHIRSKDQQMQTTRQHNGTTRRRFQDRFRRIALNARHSQPL